MVNHKSWSVSEKVMFTLWTTGQKEMQVEGISRYKGTEINCSVGTSGYSVWVGVRKQTKIWQDIGLSTLAGATP